MKKVIALAIIAAMAVSMFVLVSCGGEKEDLSDSKYVGRWECSEMSLKDESGDLDDVWVVTVNGDGTGTTEYEGETGEFTWKPVDGGFKTKGDIKTTFKDDGDKIKATILGVELVFEKK